MFFKKSLLKKNSTLKSLSINNFAGGLNSVTADAYLSNSTAKVSYNVNGESGVLKEGNGVVAFEKMQNGGLAPVLAENKKIKKLWYFKRYCEETLQNDDMIVFLSQDNLLYGVKVKGEGGAFVIDENPFSSAPCAINYRLKGQDVIIFCSDKDDMRVFDGVNAPYAVQTAPKVSSMCVHYDRLFATLIDDKNTLVFSDDLDPTNWEVGIEEAGYVTMTDDRGALLKVVSFLNYLYVFREYGISRLTASGMQESFSLTHLFATTGKIFGDTVCVCGNTVLFLSEQGLFQFDGSSAKKILANLDGFFDGRDNSRAVAGYCDGKYYLSANVNFNDGQSTSAEKNGCVNNALLEVDLFDGSASLMRGLDVVSVAEVNGDGINGAFLCFGENQPFSKYIGRLTRGGKIFNSNTLKTWVCPKSDLNSIAGKKKLLYATLLTYEDVTLIFDVDGKEYFFDLSGKSTGQKILLNLVGESFGLKIVAQTEKMYVSRPQLIFKEYG